MELTTTKSAGLVSNSPSATSTKAERTKTMDTIQNTNQIEENDTKVSITKLIADIESISNTDAKYKYNFRIFIPFIISTILNLIGNALQYNIFYPEMSETLETSLHIAIIVVLSIIILCCLCLFLYAAISRNSFNGILNIPDIDGPDVNLPFAIEETQNVALITLSFVFAAAVMNLILEIAYEDIHRVEDCGAAYLQNLSTSQKAACLAYRSTAMETYATACSMVLLLWFKLITGEWLHKTQEVKKKITQQYQSTAWIDNKINEVYQKAYQRKDSHQKEIILAAIISLLYHLANAPFFTVNIRSYGWEVVTVSIIFRISDAIAVAISLHFFIVVYYHFKLPSSIMKSLRLVNAKTIDDLIGWYLLRKYHIFYIAHVHAPFYSAIISLFLLGSCTLSVYAFVYMHSLFFGWALFCMMFTFLVVTEAVGYLRNQLYHSHTMNQERLQWKRCELTRDHRDHNNEEEPSLIYEIMDRIDHDIEKNCIPLSVFGVRMDDNFLLFLRATTGTIIIALLIESL